MAAVANLNLAVIAAAAGIAFLVRQRRARNPLYDLQVAGRRVFWVAACAGLVVFGTLMGAMFIGQQFLQSVLGCSTLDAGLAILPAAAFMVLAAPRSAKLVEVRGAGSCCSRAGGRSRSCCGGTRPRTPTSPPRRRPPTRGGRQRVV